MRGKYPITATLKDGTIMELQNPRVINLPWKNIASQGGVNGSEYNVRCDLSNKVAIIRSVSNNEENARVYESINNGDLWSIFVKDEYRILPVQDRIVIDIGANIGDSSIYFVLKGAKKIIALEPCLNNYSIAKSNLRTNNFVDKITLILAGCSSTRSHIDICHSIDINHDFSEMHVNNDNTQFSLSHRDKNQVGHDFSVMHFKNNEVIPLLTIKDILDKFEIKNKAVLKMDCEGCEYESILSAPLDTLQRFSHILLEYHYGYKDLMEKLKSSGFDVLVSSPIYKRENPKSSYLGYLFATLMDN